MSDGAMTPLSYVAGTVVSDELVFILSQVDELNRQSAAVEERSVGPLHDRLGDHANRP
jgi:hypothetical protein